jgi:hypothetical protein
MSNSYNYLPIPPRVWSRVQNQCTYVLDSSYNSVYIPLTNQTVSPTQAIIEDKLIYKGNILQYKGNSAQFTKSQKYSQLARMAGPNRKKVYATQTQTYTNPNTTGLQRVNYTTIPFPNGVTGEPNNISGPYQYNVPNPNGCSGTSLQDGGTLRCGYYANPCTGELIRSGATSATICNPASASNVPGFSILCWNNKVQTWFPKPRYVMNNSTDKWPEGYKGFVSATTPSVPVLTVNSTTCNSVTLSWDVTNNVCTPISSYNIYLDGILIQTQPYTITSTTIYGLSPDTTYYFYITSVSNTTESLPSNIVNNTTCYLSISALPNSTTNTQIQITWTYSCLTTGITNWKLYQNGSIYGTYPVGTTTTSITGLVPGNTYTYYVTSLNNGIEECPSNTITVNPINTTVQQTVPGNYTYTIPSGSLSYISTVIGGGGGGGGGAVMGTQNSQGCIGGSGGGGGGISIKNSSVSITSQTTFTYTVGIGGTAGSLTSGGNGSASSFSDGLSTSLNANGGNSGTYNSTIFSPTSSTFNAGGTGGTASGGDINGTGGNGGNSGALGEPTDENTGFIASVAGGISTVSNGPGGGGGGGCIYRTTGEQAVYFDSTGSNGGNGGNSAVGGTAGQYSNGGSGTGTLEYGGSGGGGVGGNRYANTSTITGTAGSGIYGSGGGGGGASHNSSNIGNGGAGGNGFVSFTIYRIVIS